MIGYSRVHLYTKNYHSMTWFCKVIVPIRRVQFFMPHSVDLAPIHNIMMLTPRMKQKVCKPREEVERGRGCRGPRQYGELYECLSCCMACWCAPACSRPTRGSYCECPAELQRPSVAKQQHNKQHTHNTPRAWKLTLWCQLLPYGYGYKASCARPG